MASYLLIFTIFISVTTPSIPIITSTTGLSETTTLSANITTSLTGLPYSVLSNSESVSTLTFISEGNLIYNTLIQLF